MSGSQTASPVSQVIGQGHTLDPATLCPILPGQGGQDSGLAQLQMLWPQSTGPIRSAYICWGWGRGTAIPPSTTPKPWGPCHFLSSTGFYCLLPGLAAVSGPCGAGFHCTRGSSVPNPTDGITGDLCPPGHFCPQGSPRPTPCPPGESPTGEHQQCKVHSGLLKGGDVEAWTWDT